MKITDFTVKDRADQPTSLKAYEGKVLLIVNTATGCGYTPQYAGLEELYEKYKAQGFEILDFPCNQFANQAPGSNEEIHEFCALKYHISFPQFGKLKVKGLFKDPLYKHLTSLAHPLGGAIAWNFTKFLVDKQGNVVKRYEPGVKPEDFEKDIAFYLAEK